MKLKRFAGLGLALLLLLNGAPLAAKDQECEYKLGDEIKDLEIEVPFNVVVRKGKEFTIKTVNLPEDGKRDKLGRTRLQIKGRKAEFEFELEKKLTASMPDFKSREVIITIPHNLDEVSIHSELGAAQVEDISIARLDCELEVGAVTIDSCQIDKADLSLELGTAEITDSEFSRLDCSLEMGALTMSGVVHDELEVSTEMGAVEVLLDQSLAKAGFELETDLGAVTVNGKEVSRTYKKPGRSPFIQVETDMGAINIDEK